jgi:BASS family bile acid:Na+ symporter
MVSGFEQALFAGMLFFIMFGMGAALTPRDFFLAIRRPQTLILALVAQFGIMPLLAFVIGRALSLPEAWAIGLLIVGCVPGGTTSNIFTYFAKGDLALSILMTVNSTLFGAVLTPTLLYLYAQGLSTHTVEVPLQNIAVTTVLLIVPVALGMGLRRLNANYGAFTEFFGSALGVLFIFVLIFSWVPRNWRLLVDSPWQVYAASIGIGLLGFGFAYIYSRVLKLNRVQSQTVSLETGIQNGVLAIGIVLLSFDDAVKNDVLLVPALYSLFIVLTASVVTYFFRRINDRSHQKVPALL